MSSAESASSSQVLEARHGRVPATLAQSLKEAALRYGERAMAEAPRTLRRLRLFLVVAAVSLPLFLLGVLVVVAMALHVHL